MPDWNPDDFEPVGGQGGTATTDWNPEDFEPLPDLTQPAISLSPEQQVIADQNKPQPWMTGRRMDESLGQAAKGIYTDPNIQLPEGKSESPAFQGLGAVVSQYLPVDQQTGSKIAAGLYNTAKGVPEFLSSGLGIATMGFGAAPKVADSIILQNALKILHKALPLAFVPGMAKTGGQKLGEASVTGDVQTATEGLASLGMAGTAGIPAGTIAGDFRGPEGKIQVRSPESDLIGMQNRESDVRAVNAGSPFLRANAPGEGPINMGLQPPIVGRDPSGLRLVQEPQGLRLVQEPQVQPAQPFPEISPPAPSMGPEYQSGRAAQNVREMGNQRAREQDFSQAIAEQVSQQHEQPIHPDKPLTDNQLRIVKESLDRAIGDNRLGEPEKRPGVISGSKAEAWADNVLKGGGTHGGTDVIAAYMVKGAAVYERGIRGFAEWSAEMVKMAGEAIKPHLEGLWKQVQEMGKSRTETEDQNASGLPSNEEKVPGTGPVAQGGGEEGGTDTQLKPPGQTGGPGGTPQETGPQGSGVALTADQGKAAELNSLRAARDSGKITPEQSERLKKLEAEDAKNKNKEAWIAQMKAELAKNKPPEAAKPAAPDLEMGVPKLQLPPSEGGTTAEHLTAEETQAALGETRPGTVLPPSPVEAPELTPKQKARLQARVNWAKAEGFLGNSDANIEARSGQPPAETLEARNARWKAEEDAVVKQNMDKIPENSTGVVLKNKEGQRATITRNTGDNSKWRLTWFKENGEPAGHATFDTREDALRSGLGIKGNYKGPPHLHPGYEVVEARGPKAEPTPTPEPKVESVTPLDRQSGSPLSATDTLLGKLGELQEKPGVIRGSKLEKWANEVLKDTSWQENLGSGGGGAAVMAKQMAAVAVKGAALIEKGVTNSAEWTRELVKEFGPEIRPYLAGIRKQSEQLRAGTFAKQNTTNTPPMSGGGGAATPPLQMAPAPGGSAGADVYGIAQRVREKRAESGQVAPVEPGKGITTPDSIDRGRDLLKSGGDAEKALSDFEKTKSVSADNMAITRAKGEELALAARRIEEKSGTDSAEFRAAQKALSDWDARTKPMQTEWHKAGMAQQGETDIDTGSYSGLAREFKAQTGKDFNPSQQETAKGISRKVKNAGDAAETARQNLYKQAETELGNIKVPEPKSLDEARSLFVGFESGKGFTPKQVKTVWNAARKFYLDAGVTNFDDIRKGLATDLGLSIDDVTKALGQPKGVKRLTDEMWKKQQDARRLDQQAKRWLINQSIPKFQRALQSVPRKLFGLKVGFHGTVALGTHSPMVFFQPPFWKSYVVNYGKMYRMVGTPIKAGQAAASAYYEMQVQNLLRKPNYITARRAGLVNDPFQFEDYNDPKVTEYFGRLTGMGNRGYSVLKMLRQDMFDQHWNNLPESDRVPEVAESIADGVNHATGVVKSKAPKGSSIALFAPRLEASRVAWLAVDPARAIKTFASWKTASRAEKVFAMNQVKEKAWVAGTLLSLLALNQGFLMASGSKQKVNMGNPMKSDWMKFKGFGMDFSYGNAMITMARLPVRLYQIRESNGGKLRNLIYPDESSYTVLGEYARSQMSPFASLASSLWLKGDWQNRPLPDSTRPVPKRLRAQGVKPYTWREFWSEQLAPIPIEEGLRDVWKNGLGMSDEQIRSARKAMATIAIMSATGARLVDDTSVKKATAQGETQN